MCSHIQPVHYGNKAFLAVLLEESFDGLLCFLQQIPVHVSGSWVIDIRPAFSGGPFLHRPQAPFGVKRDKALAVIPFAGVVEINTILCFVPGSVFIGIEIIRPDNIAQVMAFRFQDLAYVVPRPLLRRDLPEGPQVRAPPGG